MRWSRRQPQPAAGAGHDEKDAAPEVAQRPLSIPIVIWQPDNSVALASAATVAAAAGTPPIGCSLTAAEGLEVKDGVSELSVGSSSGRSSICAMKRNIHVVVPEGRFSIMAGKDNLQCYQFNTGVAKHLFCKTCGICPFYRPRSNPDGYAVTIWCITSPTVKSMTVKKIHGQDWENAVATSGIQALSKVA
ncbi:hypothetical protein N2152v2_000955 [Parachlorella kessleri]